MYSNGFVVSIHDSKSNVLRENKNKEVFLPFDSEYKIRLRNKHKRKAVAEITIDGTKILGENRIIIEPNSSTDVERFCIDGDLKNGNKFKFVRADENNHHPGVQDPTSIENGNVKVRFWLEKKDEIGYLSYKLFKEKEIYYYKGTVPYSVEKPIYYSNNNTFYSPLHTSSNWNCISGGEGTQSFSSCGKVGIGNPSPNQTLDVKSCYSNNLLDMSDNIILEQNNYVTGSCDKTFFHIEDAKTGATVEGESSSQTFNYEEIEELESECTVICLQIKPFKKPITVKTTKNKYCDSCGAKNKYFSNFCHSCGKNLKGRI